FPGAVSQRQQLSAGDLSWIALGRHKPDAQAKETRPSLALQACVSALHGGRAGHIAAYSAARSSRNHKKVCGLSDRKYGPSPIGGKAWLPKSSIGTRPPKPRR